MVWDENLSTGRVPFLLRDKSGVTVERVDGYDSNRVDVSGEGKDRKVEECGIDPVRRTSTSLVPGKVPVFFRGTIRRPRDPILHQPGTSSLPPCTLTGSQLRWGGRTSIRDSGTGWVTGMVV